MAPLTLVGQSRSVGDLARASSSPLDDYAAKEKAFLAASHDVKRPWLAGSLDHSKCIDANKGETLLNIVTSLVYNAAAFHIPKRYAPIHSPQSIGAQDPPCSDCASRQADHRSPATSTHPLPNTTAPGMPLGRCTVTV